MSDEGDDYADYDSGPFCRHWSDPGCCDGVCVCGHRCGWHSIGEDTSCDKCDCAAWDEVEEK